MNTRSFCAAAMVLAVLLLSAPVLASDPEPIYRAISGAEFLTQDAAGRDVITHFHGLDDVDLSGLLVNTTEYPDDDGAILTRQDVLTWRIRADGVIVIAGAHYFVRSGGILYRIARDAQTLTPLIDFEE